MTVEPTPGAGFAAHPVPIIPATDLGSVHVLKRGPLFLLSDPFGDITPGTRGLGLYLGDTRVLSCASLRVDGLRPALLQSDDGGTWQGTIHLTNPDLHRDPADKMAAAPVLPRQSYGITRHRELGPGMAERITVANYTMAEQAVTLELTFDSDGADIFEVRGYARPARGELLPIEATPQRLTFRYRGLDQVVVQTEIDFDAPAEIGQAGDGADGSVAARWRWVLPAGGRQTLSWEARPSHRPAVAEDDLQPRVPPWTAAATAIETDNELVDLVVARGLTDLELLATPGPGANEWSIAAGVPWFATLFGRDAIITALEALPFRPELAPAMLQVLAARQAEARDDWRDAEPGKILHELRTGEMARTGELPHTPYYGSIDATPLWLVLLGATIDWTGDLGLLDRLWPHALRALHWLDHDGDRDGDGFLEYETRSTRGLRNQGWKDSSDSIRDRTGRPLDPPIALAEAQGYAYDARRRLAGLARLRGEASLAARLETQAAELRARFETAFWVADRGFYAMALDAGKRQADALGSNMGHCLWSGIVDPERAAAVAARLTGRDLASGWGIRTYGADEPGFNPLGYHTGTVWPHDTAIAAAGLKRYGFHDAAGTLAGQLLEAAQHVPSYRLPELFCGFEREATGVPVPYPVACSPQAWAAGAPLLLLTTLLGLRPSAVTHELELVRPTLPPWLGKVVIKGLRVGEASVDLLFHRWRGTTSAEILRRDGPLEVTVRL